MTTPRDPQDDLPDGTLRESSDIILPAPKLQYDGHGYLVEWPTDDFRMRLDRLEETRHGELHAEVAVYTDSTTDATLHWSRFNLMSTRARAEVVRSLASIKPGVPDWSVYLLSAIKGCVEHYRRGEQVVPVGLKPGTMRVEYQLAPILEKGQPTTIYGPGASAKSYLADYIAVLVQLNIAGIPSSDSCWLPTAGNVLYLDWEASKADHERRVWAIKQGLDIDSEDVNSIFLYRFCSQPLVSDIPAIQSLVSQYAIDLIIVDSQMAAMGYGPDAAQAASQYYNALRTLRCTSLTVDHVSKEAWKGTDSIAPYGSVVKYNRSRSQFEIKKSQDTDDNSLELSLIHRKHNEGKLLKPIGIRLLFHENPIGELESVTFENCNLAENPELSKTLPLPFLIRDLLRHGPLNSKEGPSPSAGLAEE